MRTHSPLFLLAALGALTLALPAAAQVDTSQWKCTKCPYPAKGTQGAIEVGAGYTSDDSTTFGNYTGLDKKGAHLVLGGEVRHRGEGGYFADLTASDLGLDIRSLEGRAGREGQYSLSLGYAEIPRYFAEGARTPFGGNGGSLLTLPAGFAAPTTGAMPLATTLQPVELGYQTSRFDLGGKWVGMENWTYAVALRRDVRDGTKPTAGSFFSTASQLAQQVDQTTDQLELSASYAKGPWQGSVSYLLSSFRSGDPALTWANPFTPVVPGATQGQLAQAPDNQFQQLSGSVGYQISPTLRASADLAIGQGRQDETYLDPTLNTNPAAGLPGRSALPVQSLDGLVSTLNFNAKLTATPMTGLRLLAQYVRDVRDNETDVHAYTQVATDMFLAPARSNTPFDIVSDRFKFGADYRAIENVKLNGGLDWEQRERSFQEATTTRETTLWGRATWQALEPLALSFNLAYGDRNVGDYGITYWFGSPQNPLMRKVNLAPRERASAGARADWAVNDQISIGVGADWSNDDYNETVIGLNESETTNLYADLSLAVSENLRVHAYVQDENIESRQTGSQSFGAPDWTGKVKDHFSVFGIGFKHAVIPDKLDVGADLTYARSRTQTSVQTVMAEPAFPNAQTSLDRFKLYASYKLSDKMTLKGSYWYEHYSSADWRVDGVQPATLYDFLAFGNAAPRYNVHVLQLALRYAF